MGCLSFRRLLLSPAADGAVDGCVLLQASMGKHRLGVLVLVDHAWWGRDRRARMVGTRPPRMQPGRVSRKHESGLRRRDVAGMRPLERQRRRRGASQKVFFSNFETDHGYWGSPATR